MRDVDAFLATLKARNFFDRDGTVTVARAPGRLDVMGGIADYSGALVLQRPIAEATFAAVQPIDELRVRILSLTSDAGGRDRTFTIDFSSIAPGGNPLSYEEAQGLFQATAGGRWSGYVAGVFVVLMRECNASFSRGANIAIESDVPAGKGVASSAALEVATMQAITAAFGLKLPPHTMALLCQKVENLVVGAPCGIMDQMASMCGEADSLMALLCRPAELQPSVRVPDEIAFWGLDSGERHAVSGSDYVSVRTGAFMGRRMIEEAGGATRGYLANISPAEFESEFAPLLPETMPGEQFLKRYGGTADPVTAVDPSRIYRIRRPTAHPVFEHHRVQAFRDLLFGSAGEEQWTRLGELMYQSHASYSSCGLGSHGTDTLVALVREEGPAHGLYGARITGGGSGGTVAVLGRADAGHAVVRVTQNYARASGYRGHQPYVFRGASDGAARFGARVANLNA